MRRYIAAFMLLSLLLLTGLNNNASAVAQPEADAVLDKMEAVGRTLNSLVATLWQQKTNTQLGIEEPAETGEIHYLPAKNSAMKLRIDITKPTTKTVVIVGDIVKFYQHDINQLLITSLKGAKQHDSFGSLAVTFGSVSAIRASYNVSFVKKDEKVGDEMASVLALTPKQGGPYKEIQIWISQNAWLPIQQRLVENNGDVTIVRLSGLKPNAQFNVKSLIDNFNPPNAKVVKG
jgi:outer membrane lipoprotein-sorting protein